MLCWVNARFTVFLRTVYFCSAFVNAIPTLTVGCPSNFGCASWWIVLRGWLLYCASRGLADVVGFWNICMPHCVLSLFKKRTLKFSLNQIPWFSFLSSSHQNPKEWLCILDSSYYKFSSEDNKKNTTQHKASLYLLTYIVTLRCLHCQRVKLFIKILDFLSLFYLFFSTFNQSTSQ